jgi:hypothetical protein
VTRTVLGETQRPPSITTLPGAGSGGSDERGSFLLAFVVLGLTGVALLGITLYRSRSG